MKKTHTTLKMVDCKNGRGSIAFESGLSKAALKNGKIKNAFGNLNVSFKFDSEGGFGGFKINNKPQYARGWSDLIEKHIKSKFEAANFGVEEIRILDGENIVKSFKLKIDGKVYIKNTYDIATDAISQYIFESKHG